jgi:hypothetical protein
MNIVRGIKHRLYSFPHFSNVSHSALLGIERTLPIKGSFLGPGGRCCPWRRPPLQYTTKTPRVPRMKASWGNSICGLDRGILESVLNLILHEMLCIRPKPGISQTTANTAAFKATAAKSGVNVSTVTFAAFLKPIHYLRLYLCQNLGGESSSHLVHNQVPQPVQSNLILDRHGSTYSITCHALLIGHGNYRPQVRRAAFEGTSGEISTQLVREFSHP